MFVFFYPFLIFSFNCLHMHVGMMSGIVIVCVLIYLIQYFH